MEIKLIKGNNVVSKRERGMQLSHTYVRKKLVRRIRVILGGESRYRFNNNSYVPTFPIQVTITNISLDINSQNAKLSLFNFESVTIQFQISSFDNDDLHCSFETFIPCVRIEPGLWWSCPAYMIRNFASLQARAKKQCFFAA